MKGGQAWHTITMEELEEHFEGLWTPTGSPALVLLSVKLLELSDPPCQAGGKARMVSGGQRDGWSGYLTCGFSFSDKVLRFRDARWIV